APDKSYVYPDRLSLFAAAANGPVDHVALLVRRLTKAGGAWAEENRLHLLDLLGQTKAEVPLWKNMPIGPVLAVTPQGRFIAVAGHEDHAIRVYAIADLLRGAIQPQVLH